MKKRFYITTPIYYVNADPHIGTAYTTLVCDVLARFKRLEGYDVKFLTGTDEHGQKISQSANKSNLKEQEFVDQVSKKFLDLFKLMNISNNDFIRTTQDRHKECAIAFWDLLQENGHIYLDKYSGWYSVRDESFYSEDELVDGKAPTGAEVEWIEEESYFFNLSKWEDKLLEFYQKNPDFVFPKYRFNEIVSFVKGGLRDLSISRVSFKWGVPVPNNPEHVIYVWLDALTNYISALGFPEKTNDMQNFWPADVHMVGKDITKFHAIYWPAFLMAAGIDLPKQVVSHGWWLNEGEKISKSLGNVIDPVSLIGEYGLDQVRYYLMREMSFGNDGSFSKSSFLSRINSDLANKIGNLVQRTLSMSYKNCSESIPQYSEENISEIYAEYDILKDALSVINKVKEKIDQYNFHHALEVIISFVDDLNIFVDHQAPWELKKTDQQKMEKVLYVVLESVRYFSILLIPFIPDSANRILDNLLVPQSERDFNFLFKEYALKGGAINKPEGIFPRLG
ncbi:MAG: methionine--tRNA ligase [Alphaproteobacteria bacterium]|nr:methionine--tRNA ligase [Alphaproteobacteria bacterium]